MTSSQVELDVLDFLADTFPLAGGGPDHPDASLVDAGIIDSVGVLELIDFLEQRYGILVGDEELLPENLDSVQRIGAFVERKTAAAPAVS